MTSLEITIDGGPPRSFPIGEGPVVVGRAATCDVRLDDPACEPRHLRVSLEWCLHDLAEGQPVLLRGRRVTRDWVEFGEEFTIGSAARVKARLVPDVAAPVPAPELEALRRRVRDLEAERADLQAQVNTLEHELEEARSQSRTADSRVAEEAARARVRGLRTSEPPDEADLARVGAAGIAVRFDILLDVLLGFVERLETTTDRVLRVAGRAEGSGVFERRGLRRALGRAFAARSDAHARELLDGQIQLLMTAWVNGTLKIYRNGVEVWARDFLGRISPKSIQIRAGISDARLEFGMGHKRLWEAYREFVLELTPDILVEQIDDAVQRSVPELR